MKNYLIKAVSVISLTQICVNLSFATDNKCAKILDSPYVTTNLSLAEFIDSYSESRGPAILDRLTFRNRTVISSQQANNLEWEPETQVPVVPSWVNQTVVEVLPKSGLKRIGFEKSGQNIVFDSEIIPNEIPLIVPSIRIIEQIEIKLISGESFTLRFNQMAELSAFDPPGYSKQALSFYFYTESELSLAINSVFGPVSGFEFTNGLPKIRAGDLSELSRKIGDGVEFLVNLESNNIQLPLLNSRSIASVTCVLKSGNKVTYEFN